MGQVYLNKINKTHKKLSLAILIFQKYSSIFTKVITVSEKTRENVWTL